MSAPDTNVEKQAKRHKPALGGMGFAAIFAGVLLVVFVSYLFLMGDEPEAEGEQVQPLIGATEDG